MPIKRKSLEHLEVSDDTTEPSKTERKREATRLQKIGLRIAELPTEQRQRLELPENVAHAIDEYIRFPSREAKRRQLQYVGRVMRSADVSAIESQLDDLVGESAQAQYLFHQAELWRDRLIHDNALSQFIDTYPSVDRQQLRHTIQKVQSAKTEDQRKSQSRKLFRLLRETMETHA